MGIANLAMTLGALCAGKVISGHTPIPGRASMRSRLGVRLKLGADHILEKRSKNGGRLWTFSQTNSGNLKT
jgi:hypothetical protein